MPRNTFILVEWLPGNVEKEQLKTRKFHGICHLHKSNKMQHIFLELGDTSIEFKSLDKVKDVEIAKLRLVLPLQSFKFHVPTRVWFG